MSYEGCDDGPVVSEVCCWTHAQGEERWEIETLHPLYNVVHNRREVHV